MILVYDCQGRLGFSFATLSCGLPNPYNLYFVDGENLVSSGTHKDKFILKCDGFHFDSPTYNFYLDREWSECMETIFKEWISNPLISGEVVCEDFYTYLDECKMKGITDDY